MKSQYFCSDKIVYAFTKEDSQAKENASVQRNFPYIYLQFVPYVFESRCRRYKWILYGEGVARFLSHD